MAATSTPKVGAVRAFDVSHNGKYNVQLGPCLKEPNVRDAKFSSVAFNHKPSQTSVKRSTTIETYENDSSTCTLSVIDQDNGDTTKTEYRGRQRSETESYILTLSEDGQSFILEPLAHQYKFNMVSAPWEEDEATLQQQYKQIDMDENMTDAVDNASSEKEEELFGGDSDEPDPDNPFDYRHYLNMQPFGLPVSRNASNAGTPVIPAVTRVVTTPRPQTSSPAPRAQVAGKITKPTRPRPRAKPSPVFHARKRSDSPKQITLVSTPEPPSSGDEGLVFELGGESRSLKKRPNAIGSLSKGRPVSLRAAATNPRPPTSTKPRSPIPQEIGSGYEEDSESADGEGEEHDGGGADDDVDELNLPGPAVESGDHVGHARRQSTWDEETADVFTENLAAMLAEEDEEVEEEAVAPDEVDRKVLARKHDDSDSESEEE